MVDIYAVIAIGTALTFGLIPLIRQLIKKDRNFLVHYYINKPAFDDYIAQLKKNGDWIG